MHEYLSFKKIIACGGSFMVKNDDIDSENWGAITAAARETVKELLDFKLAHIGINSDNAINSAHRIADIFGGDVTGEDAPGVFACGIFELMKQASGGKCGHIAVSTPNAERAVYYLKKRGVHFDDTSAKYDAHGILKFIYLSDDFDGFKIHLIEA